MERKNVNKKEVIKGRSMCRIKNNDKKNVESIRAILWET